MSKWQGDPFVLGYRFVLGYNLEYRVVRRRLFREKKRSVYSLIEISQTANPQNNKATTHKSQPRRPSALLLLFMLYLLVIIVVIVVIAVSLVLFVIIVVFCCRLIMFTAICDKYYLLSLTMWI